MNAVQEPPSDASGPFAFAAVWPLWLFSACIVSLTFKQLRADSFAGPTEWLTAIVALMLVVDSLRRGTLQQNRYIFGATLIFAALSLGGLWAFFVDPQRLELREVAAHIFTFVVVVAFLTLAWRRETAALTILACVISLYLVIILLLAFVPNPLQAKMMWIDGMRLQGLSDNPNQIAFLAIASLALLVRAEVWGELSRKIVIPLALACVLAGIWSWSGAFILALVFLTILFIGIALFEGLSGGWWDKNKSKRNPLALAIVGLLLFGSVVQHNGDAIIRFATLDTTQLTEIMEADAGQGFVRVELWERALAVGAQSPVVGHGPGYHLSGHSQAHLQEAHNTFIDLFVFSGLVGILALGLIGVLAIRGAFQNGRLPLVLLMGTAIVTFAMFHYVGRHPIFWIVIFAIVYSAGSWSLPRVSSGRQASASDA